jgi:hypothetical protein
LLRFEIQQREQQVPVVDEVEGHDDPTTKTTEATSERHQDSKASIREAIATAVEQRQVTELTKSSSKINVGKETDHANIVVDTDAIDDINKSATNAAGAVGNHDIDDADDDADEKEEVEKISVDDVDDSDDIELALENDGNILVDIRCVFTIQEPPGE